MAKVKDKWAQLGFMTVTESAANTLTMAGLAVFSNILTPKGLVIHKIEYNLPTATVDLLVGDNDSLVFGLCGDDALTTIALDDARIYDFNALAYHSYGTPANMESFLNPVVRDFSDLPGGGMLVPADRLYMYVQGVSLASAAVIQCRFRFTLQDLTAQEYIELAQALRVLT